MKREYLLSFFLMFSIGIFSCNNNSKTRTKPDKGVETGEKKSLGKIEFTKELHNFGTLKEGEIVSYSFQFKNNGTAPFRLIKVEPTCGCLSVQFDKEEIGIQCSSVIDVIFHSEGEWGNQIKTVSIETSAGEVKTLTIGAYVENKNFNIELNSLK